MPRDPKVMLILKKSQCLKKQNKCLMSYGKEEHEFSTCGSFLRLVFQTMSLYIFLEYIFIVADY